MLKEGLGDLRKKQIPLTHQKRKKRSYTELKFLRQKNIGFKKNSCFNDINLQNTLFVKLLVARED